MIDWDMPRFSFGYLIAVLCPAKRRQNHRWMGLLFQSFWRPLYTGNFCKIQYFGTSAIIAELMLDVIDDQWLQLILLTEQALKFLEWRPRIVRIIITKIKKLKLEFMPRKGSKLEIPTNHVWTKFSSNLVLESGQHRHKNIIRQQEIWKCEKIHWLVWQILLYFLEQRQKIWIFK